jgi:L-amino acid N-acyltransferase YncA
MSGGASDVAGAGGGGGARPDLPRYLVRAATADDLDAIAGFEVEIAQVSFGDDAVTDAGLHRRRVAGSLGKPGEITLVAAAESEPGIPVGWAWLSGRTNSLTGARYGNFRSLAVAEVPGRSQIGELLLAAVLQAASDAGLRQLTGKVHARNLGMRSLYRKFGFEAAHVTMEKRLPDQGWEGGQETESGQEPAGEQGGQAGGRKIRP